MKKLLAIFVGIILTAGMLAVGIAFTLKFLFDHIPK